MDGSGIALSCADLTKRFGGFTAVDRVSLQVRTGTVHALIGPNGAGKTTCFNLLTRFLRPDQGRIEYMGRDITRSTPEEVARQGLVRSFQISAVFLGMTALQNVRVALMQRRGLGPQFWASATSMAALDEPALALLRDVGLEDEAYTRAAQLPYGRKRALELAMTLALEPKVLLLDEPMAGLGSEDIERIASLIKRVAANRTILMVEHNLSVVARICDFITVLARGAILAEGRYEEVSRDPRVVTAYMGTEAEGAAAC
jgi:branched-chain amino acid transport system ATP-binding protein